jgi:hypothetical protein
METKKCPKCLKVLPVDLFNKRGWCKLCVRTINRANYTKYNEHYKKRSREYYNKNREQALQYKRDLYKSNPEKYRKIHKEWRRNKKITVIEHYGNKCACCGETNIVFLCIDHVNGGGNKHRKTLGDWGVGANFYRWLINNNFPDGFRVLCHNCNFAYGEFGKCPHQKQ